MSKILSIVLLLCFIATLAACGSGSEALDTTGLSQITLRIEGMTWGGWALAVRRALEGLDGVKKAEVSFREKEAVVYFEKAKVTVDEMVRAVTTVGFRATEKSSPWSLVTWGQCYGWKKIFQDWSLGFNHRSNLLFHSGSRDWARINWIRSTYPISWLRFVSLTWDLFVLGALRLVKKKKRGQLIWSEWLPRKPDRGLIVEKDITVYSATGWASCHAAKEFLSHHKIPFTDRNVAEDPDALRELTEKTGRRATPVIVIDGEVVVGFDRGKLERLLGL